MPEERQLEPAVPLKLSSLEDLARMLVFWVARERGASILYFEKDGKHIYGALTVSFPGYYELRGVPLFICVIGKEAPKGQFLRYQGQPEESIAFVKSIEIDPKYQYIPIIKLAEPPKFVGKL
ncbi:MAG: hypothetical protein QXS27_02950 [Candidatus Jordarchaeaceae archaeon]|nr:hypothetical protein [Candidatus Jordarchaeia archaeon]MBS7269620.1 hypothetical protein [Candidatus Jordarchaeia archaeon]MBS7281193.1 hypothetical protein [Candidatus Jordarchaeia archaeon]MBS7281629.1 hypothetical protein [Candidatus Jordarchaeia archaeon]